MKNPEKLLEFIIKQITSCDASLQDIFKASDKNGDGTIDFNEFKEGMVSTGIKYPEDVMKQVYKRFNHSENNSLSYVEFLATIYGDKDKKKDFLNYLLKAEQNLDKLKLLIREKFKNFDDMFKKMQEAGKQGSKFVCKNSD